MPRLAAAVLLILAHAGAPAARAVDPPQTRFAGQPLVIALEKIQQEGVNVIFSTRLVRPEMHVAAEPVSTTPRAILEELLSPHGLAVADGPQGSLVVVLAGSLPWATGVIRGLVRAQDTGGPLAGAEVSVGGRGQWVWSGDDGSFCLSDLPPGVYDVEARAAGYSGALTCNVSVGPGVEAEVSFELCPYPRFLQEVVVTPSHFGYLHRQPETRQLLNRSEVERLPHLSDDLFRVAHRLPGVAAGDISAGFAVRGGAPDETMVLLDGLQIHDPYHLRDFFSLFSIVDSEVVDGVDLLTGGFPVEYGDRMSGIIDLRSTTPKKPRAGLAVTGVHARALAEGLLGEDGGSWLVMARRGYLDWLLGWLGQIDEEPDFQSSPKYWDAFATIKKPISKRSVLSLELLVSHDVVDVFDSEDRERAHGLGTSAYAWARLQSSLGGGLSADSLVSASWVDRTLVGNSEPDAIDFTKTRDERRFTILGVKQDWILEPGRSHLLKWGADLRQARASYELDSTFIIREPLVQGQPPPGLLQRQATVQPRGWQVGAYTADRFRLLPGVTAELGVRWDHQSWTPGEDQLSPRLNVVWETTSAGTFRLAWGRFAQSQSIYELQVEDGVTDFFPAQWAEHRVLSWQHVLGSGESLRIECYQKRMTDLRPHFENLLEAMDLFPEGEADRVLVSPDRAAARGIEVLVKGADRGRWGWWAAYTLAAVDERVDGRWVPRGWDQRHAFSANLSWQPGRSWTITVSGLFHSGWPATPFSARWAQQPDGTWMIVGQTGVLNSARHPSYRRVDLRLSRPIVVRHGRARFFVEIMNLFNHENIRSLGSYRFDPGGGGNILRSVDEQTWMPIFPTVGLAWEI